MEAFSCPNEGCVRVFQRFSSLERHLSFERCSKSLERQTLLDIAKTQYAFLLEEGVGKMPTLKSRELHVTDVSISKAEEGWALKEARKSYRFNEAQKSYLEAKYNIGQTTGRKLDAETLAREMRRSIGPDGNRLFRVSEFLTSQQVSSFFSRLGQNPATTSWWVMTFELRKRKLILTELDTTSFLTFNKSTQLFTTNTTSMPWRGKEL